MIDKIGLAILTMFGIGHTKYAPGTVASLITCFIFYFMTEDSSWVGFAYISFQNFLIIFLLLFIYSIILIDKLSHHFKKHDPKEIVIDEFFGQSIPLILIWPILINYGYLFTNFKIQSIFVIFILFRFFDIYKPFPINMIDKKMKNSLGVILDDIVAGIYTIMFFLIFMQLRGFDSIHYMKEYFSMLRW